MSGSIGGVDSSIPLQAGRGVQQPNPLQQIGEFANVQNALNQNRLFPGVQQLQQQAVQGGQVSLAQRINQTAYQGLTPILAKPAGTITHEDLTTALGSLEANQGLPTHGVLADLMSTAPTGDGPAFDQKVRSMITARAMIEPSQAVAAVTGTPTTINTGLSEQPGVVAGPGAAGFGGFTPSGAPVQVFPTRGQLVTPVTGPVDSKGGPSTVPLGAVAPPELSGINLGTGRIRDTVPAGLRNPNAPLPSTGLPGQVRTGLGPAETAALGASGTQATTGFGQIAENGNRAVQQNAMLSNMQNDLAQFTSGTGAEKTLDFKRALQSWAPGIAGAIGVDPKNVAAQESFDKLANQIADAQGAGSDARLSVTQAANPHSTLSPGGADLILRQLQGNTDYLRVLQQQAAKYPDQSDYRGFSSRMNAALDPRFFQLNRMTPQQQKDYLAAMPESQKGQFKTNYMQARNQGLLNAGQ